jgi:hypothetical protein
VDENKKEKQIVFQARSKFLKRWIHNFFPFLAIITRRKKKQLLVTTVYFNSAEIDCFLLHEK